MKFGEWVLAIAILIFLMFTTYDSFAQAAAVEKKIWQQALALVTLWGVVGTVFAAFAGPVFVQRVVKPYFCDSFILFNRQISLFGERKSKRRRFSLSMTAAGITAYASIVALRQEYTNMEAVYFVASLVALFQYTIIELVFTFTDKKNPDLAAKFSQGVYLAEDATLGDRAAAAILGERKDARRIPRTEVWTDEERQRNLSNKGSS